MLGRAGRAQSDSFVARGIVGARGQGTQIEPIARTRLERSYGTDLSGVRIHTGGEADMLARAVDARAFTSASDIFFSRSAYAPSSTDGFEVLAHEVAHVVQQSRGPVPGVETNGLRISEPSDHGEVTAQKAAVRAVRGAPAGALLGAASPANAAPAVARSVVERRDPTLRVRRSRRRKKASPAGQVPEHEPTIQRLNTDPAVGITIQRSPQPLVPLGDFDLLFNPSSSLEFTPPGATSSTKQTVNDANSTATFSGIPRGSSGTATLDVAMQWFSKAGPGPVPANCDLCEILRRALTFTIGSAIPIIGRFLPTITIGPSPALVERCRRLVRVDPEGIRPILDEIADAALDPCGKLLSFLDAEVLGPLCAGVLGLGGFVTEQIRQQIAIALRRVRKALDDCKKARGGGGAPSGTGQLVGNARSIMTTTFVSDPAGQLVFSGLSPAASQSAQGARLLIPVESVRTPTPTGGTLQQQPTLVTTTGTAATEARLFTVNLAVLAAPADADYNCSDRFGPFKVGKAVFEDEDGQIRRIRDFFFGLHPKVRQDIEEGRGNLIVTGRASKTDTQAKNLELGERRAKRVEGILRNFVGKGENLKAKSLGELGAQTVGCPDTPENPAKGPICEDPNERRADVKANGTIREAGDIDPKCTGHLGEETPTGASNPVTELEGPETAGSAVVTEPILRLFSKGENVRRLQNLLNEVVGAGLTPDGDFGSLTQKAVMAFQSGRGLQSDGIVGPQTWASLLSR